LLEGVMSEVWVGEWGGRLGWRGATLLTRCLLVPATRACRVAG